MEAQSKNKKRLTRGSYLKIKRRILARHVGMVRVAILGGIVIVILGVIFLVGIAVRQTVVGKYLGLGRIFLMRPEGVVETTEGRTNILILGKSGEGHIAPDLTDTMILASISNSSEPEITLISLPRDIWITDLRAKLNSVYYWGNKRKPGGGMVLAKSIVEEITGVPVHYGAVIDFGGFVEMIDLLGGIEVDVERSFVDTKYPIAGKENDECGGDPEYLCRYETVRFEKGKQIMDGETALKYVRSRHSEDIEEGTDFARGQRQQRVLIGIKKKALSQEVLLSPRKLKMLWEQGWAMLETDLNEKEMALLGRLVYEADGKLESKVFPEELLLNPPILAEYDNLYVFVPQKKDEDGELSWSEVQAWVKSVLER